jgi:hypothetical protein
MSTPRKAALNRARQQRFQERLREPVEVVDDSPHTWREALRYTDAGYNATPILSQDIDAGREYPPGAPIFAKVATYVVQDDQLDAYGICINCGGWELSPGFEAPPIIAALRLDIAQDQDFAAHLVDTVVKPRLRWDVDTHLMPVRSTRGSAALLIPLRLDTNDRPHFETGRYRFDSDTQPINRYLPGPVNRASFSSWREVFVASGAQYRWTDGGLPTVTRASLPTVDDARALIKDIEAALDARGTQLTYQFTNVC